MRCSFKSCEDLIYLGIFLIVAVVVGIAVLGDDEAYPLVSATSVVSSAEQRGGAETLEAAPAVEISPAPYIVTRPELEVREPVATAPMISTGDAAAH
jgi:hypothetical protein